MFPSLARPLGLLFRDWKFKGQYLQFSIFLIRCRWVFFPKIMSQKLTFLLVVKWMKQICSLNYHINGLQWEHFNFKESEVWWDCIPTNRSPQIALVVTNKDGCISQSPSNKFTDSYPENRKLRLRRHRLPGYLQGLHCRTALLLV